MEQFIIIGIIACMILPILVYWVNRLKDRS